MKVISGVVFVALIAGINSIVISSDVEPFASDTDQNRCVQEFFTENPNDADVQAVIANCPNDTLTDTNIEDVCEDQECLEPLARIYNEECGYNLPKGEFADIVSSLEHAQKS